jgi:hypothetical protein
MFKHNSNYQFFDSTVCTTAGEKKRVMIPFGAAERAGIRTENPRCFHVD